MKRILLIIILTKSNSFCFSQIVSFQSFFEVFQTERIDSAFIKLKKLNAFAGNLNWNPRTEQYYIEGIINSELFFARSNEGRTYMKISTSGSSFYDSLLARAKRELHFIKSHSQGDIRIILFFGQNSTVMPGDPVVKFVEGRHGGKRSYVSDAIEFVAFKPDSLN